MAALVLALVAGPGHAQSRLGIRPGRVITLEGLPGWTNTVERTDVLAPVPVWELLAKVVAGTGVVACTDTSPAPTGGARFYRAVAHGLTKGESIGPAGGTITVAGLTAVFPAGAYTGTVNVVLDVSPDLFFDADTLSGTFALSPPPHNTNSSITLRFAVGDLADGTILLALRDPAGGPGDDLLYSFIECVVTDGIATAVIPAGMLQTQLSDGAARTLSDPAGDAGGAFGAILKGSVRYVPAAPADPYFKVKFQRLIPPDEMDNVCEALMKVFNSYYQRLDFDITKFLPRAPLLVDCYSFKCKNQQSMVYGKCGLGSMRLNPQFNSFQLPVRLETTVAHEFMHVAQEAAGVCNFWYQEAPAVWVEQYFNGNVGEIPEMLQTTVKGSDSPLNRAYCPLRGFGNTLGIADQEYGYGMAGLIQYLAVMYGSNIVAELNDQYMPAWNNNAINAIVAAVKAHDPTRDELKDWILDFYRTYVTGGAFPKMMAFGLYTGGDFQDPAQVVTFDTNTVSKKAWVFSEMLSQRGGAQVYVLKPTDRDADPRARWSVLRRSLPGVSDPIVQFYKWTFTTEPEFLAEYAVGESAVITNLAAYAPAAPAPGDDPSKMFLVALVINPSEATWLGDVTLEVERFNEGRRVYTYPSGSRVWNLELTVPESVVAGQNLTVSGSWTGDAGSRGSSVTIGLCNATNLWERFAFDQVLIGPVSGSSSSFTVTAAIPSDARWYVKVQMQCKGKSTTVPTWTYGTETWIYRVPVALP